MHKHGHAFLVEVGKDLPVSLQDVEALKGVLLDPLKAAYPPSQVVSVMGKKATKRGIIQSLEKFVLTVNQDPDATALIYYSGHGGYLSAHDKETGYYLIPYDFDQNYWQESAIEGKDFVALVERLNCRKLVLIFDCCHAGGMSLQKSTSCKYEKSPIPDINLNKLSVGTGTIIIGSSRANEVSYGGVKNSVFTECLLEALSGKGQVDEDGYVRILETLVYILDNVPKRAPGPQHPIVNKMLELSKNFALVRLTDREHKNISYKEDDLGMMFADFYKKQILGQIHQLQSEFEIRMKKLARLRNALAIETAILQTFQLEQQILEEEAHLSRLMSKLDNLKNMDNHM